MTKADLERLLNESLLEEDAPRDPVRLTDENLDTEFGDLGVDSVAVAEVLIVLSDTYQIAISDEQAESLTTPRALIDLVASLTAGGQG
ncbi:acyl carrier protein [Actinomadura rubrisoli]|uniref:Acyl carrier protein n=1 Tax=Actinomadura rubrisoli TaxID=2530368 RepID=A0A4R5CC65_9ACTN|nr:acyl carrier protein [Actinomadura rubrisoli]TDD96449.1 acyl carrier protein [Actinomadura rubrisoli]